MPARLEKIHVGFDEGDRNCNEYSWAIPYHIIPGTANPCPRSRVILPEKILNTVARDSIDGVWICRGKLGNKSCGQSFSFSLV